MIRQGKDKHLELHHMQLPCLSVKLPTLCMSDGVLVVVGETVGMLPTEL